MPVIRVFEHERLTTHPDDHGRALTTVQFEKLCQFNDKNDNKYFTVIRNGIKFCQYVGVIQIGNLTIEILPKADKQTITKHEFDSQTRRWQKVLLKMLAISGEIELETVSEASLRKRFTLLDLYFEVYLQEVDTLLRRGLAKKYRQNEGNVKALKGRLNFSRDIERNCIHRERFYTCHQSYDHEHLINQILLKGLKILDVLSSGSILNDRIRKLLFYFPEISEITINKDSFNKIRLTRKTRDYTKALAIAKMLILNYSPDISMGDENMLALLFDMNKLWEKYIYKQLKARENQYLRVKYQAQDLFWESKSIYADIVIERKKASVMHESADNDKWEPFIIDTKWKLIDVNKPSDDDLKQMYVYNMYWNSPKSMLLYPKLAGVKDSGFGKFHKGRLGDNHCKIGFVSVLDESGGLNQEVAGEILKKIKPE
ncbi:MAG: restriction endonuclease [Bacteroidales bacterium]|nr:restriction endonuclease [Bacteroidales bacterium]